MMCCEIDLLQDAGELDSIWLPWKRLSDYLRKRPRARSITLHSTLLIALLLASFPALKMYINADIAANQCTSWPAFLFHLTPWQYWQHGSVNGVREFWCVNNTHSHTQRVYCNANDTSRYFWAAWLLSITIKRLRWAKSLFESPFPQCTSPIPLTLPPINLLLT
jgi:hypothetical protein